AHLHALNHETLAPGAYQLIADRPAVGETGTTASGHKNAHALVRATVLLHAGPDFGSRFFSQINHFRVVPPGNQVYGAFYPMSILITPARQGFAPSHGNGRFAPRGGIATAAARPSRVADRGGARSGRCAADWSRRRALWSPQPPRPSH